MVVVVVVVVIVCCCDVSVYCCTEKRTMPDISDDNEWETPIICSAIKFFFSKQLQEPLLTFDLHLEFIEAGS